MPIPPEECSEERFLNEIKTHEVKIIKDDNVFRHLECKRPNTMVCSFHITTWPGHLCISGDMGTYVFSRIRDMFEFFRPSDKELRINKGYWAEKLQAIDRTDGCKKFSSELFEAQVKEVFEEYEFEDEEKKKEVWQEIKDLVLPCAYDGEYVATKATMDFEHEDAPGLFSDFWEYNFRSYTYLYTWCLYAIVWAIKEYDKKKEKISV